MPFSNLQAAWLAHRNTWNANAEMASHGFRVVWGKTRDARRNALSYRTRNVAVPWDVLKVAMADCMVLALSQPISAEPTPLRAISPRALPQLDLFGRDHDDQYGR